MNCTRVRDLLPDYAVELLDARMQQAVESHLELCAGCRQELRAGDSVMALVEQYGALEPPVGLFNGVRNRIEAGGLERDRAPWWGWLFTGPARGLAMTGALAALALGLFLPAGPEVGPGLLPVHEASMGDPGVVSTALASSIRQHALSAGEGPLTDRVAWEAMAQLVVQDKAQDKPGVQ